MPPMVPMLSRRGPANTPALRLDQVVWLTVLSDGAVVGRIMKAAAYRR
jgi:hypothetical protein